MVDPLIKMASEVVADSPVLRDRLNRLVSDLLDEAEEVIESGTPRAKADLINKMIPHLVKQMHEKTEDEEITKLRIEMEIMKAAMRPQIGPAVNLPPVEEIPEDGPRQIADVLNLSKPRTSTPGSRT